MARTFNGTSDGITLSLGGVGSLSGAMSAAWIARFNGGDGASRTPLQLGVTFATGWKFQRQSTNVLGLSRNNAASSTGTTSVVVATGWVLAVVTRASGTVTPRFHIYKYNTNTWAHENGSTSQADTTPVSSVTLGNNGNGNFFLDGDIAAAGCWASQLTDAQVETLAFSLTPWFSYSPKGLWVLDQAATGTKVWDLTGNGANETSLAGTKVASSAVPVWNRGASIQVVNFASVVPSTGNQVTTGSLRLQGN